MAAKGYMRERRSMLAACREMNLLAINQGTAGNVSLRVPGGFLVTPTGVPYDELAPGMMVEMDFQGRHRGALLPSSEWRFHRDILARRPDANAVVHCHAMFATTLAIARMEIPPLHYMVAAAGGSNVRCAPYATYGTQELSDAALAALEGRRACLLANHGMIAIGADLAKALRLAVEVETLAAQYWRTLQVGGPKLLSQDEIAVVLGKFASYGQQPAARRATPRARRGTGKGKRG